MKTQVMAWAIGLTGMLGLAACSKCKDCLKKDMAVKNVCEEDYADPLDYNAAIEALESDGYSCRAAM